MFVYKGMNPLRLNKIENQGNDEFLQILKNVNNKKNDKAVFRRLLGYLKTESCGNTNYKNKSIEEEIRNIKQINKSYEETSTNMFPANMMVKFGKSNANGKISQTEMCNTKNTNSSLKMEDVIAINASPSTISLSTVEENIIYENPFGTEMDTNKLNEEKTISHGTFEESNLDLTLITEQNQSTSVALEGDLDNLSLTNNSNATLELDDHTEPEKKKKNITDSLHDKIMKKRLRNRTICDLSNIKATSTDNLESTSSQKSNQVFINSNHSANEIDLHEKYDELANKLENKRIRNRTISHRDNVKQFTQELDYKSTTVDAEDIYETEPLNKDLQSEKKRQRVGKEKITRIGKVTVLTRNFQELINRSSESVHNVSEMDSCRSNNMNQRTHFANISIASDEKQMISFNYMEKNKIESYGLNVEQREVKTHIKKHFLNEGDDAYTFSDGCETKMSSQLSSTSRSEADEINMQRSMSDILMASGCEKTLNCPLNQMLRTTKSMHNDSTRNNNNIQYNTLDEETCNLLTNYTRDQLKKEIRDKGVLADIKRFFSQMFKKKWNQKDFEKMEKPDAFLTSLHKYICDNYTNTPSMFRLSAEQIYYTIYPEKAANGESIKLDDLTPHQISALYKGYIRNILKGFVPPKIGKQLVAYLKLENISEEDKKKYIQIISPHLISSVERKHLKDIFQMWDVIADNSETTKMDIVSLCVVFGPSIVNDGFIVDIKDSKYLSTILECFYMSDLDRIDHGFYNKFIAKCEALKY